MLTAIILCLGLRGELAAAHALLLALTWSSPEVAVGPLAMALGLVFRDKGRSTESALVAGWLRTAAGELRAGSSLRSAVARAVEAYPDLGLERIRRLADAGRPLSEMSVVLAEREGMEAIAAVVAVAGSTGGSVVKVLETLATEAADEATLQREKRSLTAAARWSIVLVGGFPLAVLAAQILRGELGTMLAAGTVPAAMVVIGVSLLTLGLLTVGLLLRRVRTL
ncbi:MAG TPA: type II secretion system F family protein [Acidimicrobiia bacterium]|nr:type II secretion system F family protein [Acidimicrobiia bacterium]